MNKDIFIPQHWDTSKIDLQHNNCLNNTIFILYRNRYSAPFDIMNNGKPINFQKITVEISDTDLKIPNIFENFNEENIILSSSLKYIEEEKSNDTFLLSDDIFLLSYNFLRKVSSKKIIVDVIIENKFNKQMFFMFDLILRIIIVSKNSKNAVFFEVINDVK